jgi:hypothetical protein
MINSIELTAVYLGRISEHVKNVLKIHQWINTYAASTYDEYAQYKLTTTKALQLSLGGYLACFICVFEV